MENTKTDYKIASMLPNPLRNRVVRLNKRQCKKQGLKPTHYLHKVYTYNGIAAMFEWDDTREGVAYWADIHLQYFYDDGIYKVRREVDNETH